MQIEISLANTGDSQTQIELWKSLETRDFQNRGDKPHREGVCDNVRVGIQANGRPYAIFNFKATSIEAAKAWVRAYMKTREIPIDSFLNAHVINGWTDVVCYAK